MPEKWPDLMAIVRAESQAQSGTSESQSNVSQLGESVVAILRRTTQRTLPCAAIAGLERVLVISRIGQHAAFTFLAGGIVYAESLIVFPLSTYSAFCALQTRPHELWARFFVALR